MDIIMGYLVVVNLVGLWSMWTDKRRAIKKRYRLPEKLLFGIALAGGSVGSIIGMQLFRHKTKHWYFTWGMPCIFIIQMVILGLLIGR